MYDCFVDNYVLSLYGKPDEAPFHNIESLDPMHRLAAIPYNHLYFLACKVYDYMVSNCAIYSWYKKGLVPLWDFVEKLQY